ncbi:MAG TPA: hypothetical protein VF789_27270 [Thermoanaerobaculia bacterium]
MPKIALAATMEEWTSLLAATDNPEILAIPDVKEMRDALEVMARTTYALAAEQAALKARRQAVTQEMRIARRRGQDLVIQMRSMIRGKYGHRFEGLVRYRIRPVRSGPHEFREDRGIADIGRQAMLATIPGIPSEALAAPEAFRESAVPEGAASTPAETAVDPMDTPLAAV